VPATQPLGNVVKIVALIPAHNEAEHITATIAGLHGQSRVPDLIVVVADNCSDETASLAHAAGARVFATTDNRDKKAGALNQALARLLPALDDNDQVLIQDADTVLNPEFAASASAALCADSSVGGACARYNSPKGGGLIGMLQRNEYARARRMITRRGRTHILVGMASQFWAGHLREVIEARRSGRVPGGPEVYNRDSITEDYELTLVLRTLGYHTVAPPGCDPQTDLMHTVHELWNQRIRWYRGAMDDLRRFGWTRATAPYILRQVLWAVTSLSPVLFGTYVVTELVVDGRLQWSLPFMLINIVFIWERYVCTRHEGPSSVLLSVLLVPEMIYESFLTLVFFASLSKSVTNARAVW
jgi:cellulose synthase/poly-beta-1,6-N-acetylglucosamine synthase-like glycosyltransferase